MSSTKSLHTMPITSTKSGWPLLSRHGQPPNKRLKLAGGDRFRGSGVLCPGGLPKVPRFEQGAITGLDYRPFKLCLLSILWRASIAKQALFSHVQLGSKHERTIRQMLIEDDPGPEDLYPIAADVLWLKDYV